MKKSMHKLFLAKSELYFSLRDKRNTKKAADDFIRYSPEQNREALKISLYKKYQLQN